MSCVSVSAGGSISVVTAAQGVSVGMSYAYYPSVAYNAATSRIVYMCVDHTVFQQVGGFCGYLSSSGVLTSSPFVIEYSVTQAGPTSVTTTSTGKVIFYWESASSYPKAQIAQLPSSGNTLTNVSSSYTVNSASNSQKQLAVGIDIPTGNALFAYGSGADVYIKVASISGYTLSFGSPSSSVGVQSYGNYLAFFSMPGTNATLLFADTNGSTPLYAIPITVSGLTITIGSLQNSSSGGNYSSRPRATPDPVGLQFIVGGGNGSAVGGNTFTNVTTNLTSANFIGFSSASYTNGQTATINVVGSTNSSQSGLTAGLKYYVLGGGTLNSGATSNPYAGLARSSTSILVKG
jgi:hypothetical protein